MTKDDVIARLKKENRAAISRATGLPRHYLDHLVYQHIKNPGSEQIDKLRSHFISLDVMRGRPQ